MDLRIERRAADDPHVLTAVGHYVAELDRRFPEGFDAGGPDDLVDPRGHYLLVVDVDADPPAGGDGGRVAGVGGLRAVDRPAGAAEVKRMWVAPAYRGTGLGRRLLVALEDLARELGHQVVVLDTHRSLGEALSMYASAGYREVERYNDNPYAQAFFRKEL